MKFIANNEKYTIYELDKPLDFTESTDCTLLTEARYMIEGAEDLIAVMFQKTETNNEYLLLGFHINEITMPIMDSYLHAEILDFVNRSLNLNNFLEKEKARKNVENFIKQRGYTYTVDCLIESYVDYYKKGYYISHTTEDCIHHLENEFEVLTDAKLLL